MELVGTAQCTRLCIVNACLSLLYDFLVLSLVPATSIARSRSVGWHEERSGVAMWACDIISFFSATFSKSTYKAHRWQHEQ